MANELADRPFGGTQDTAVQVEIDKDPEQPEPAKTKRRSITLSLPQVVVEQLEAQALENKHQGKKEKNVSALVLVALKKAGYKP
ncbi:hypothetical protein [Azotobacter chroococcum]|uniref:hypothetical protein n=1 Tax=Azotobacter chroococcum TaxID=353 RepID=UPI0010AEDAC9|nr:hypothetical protein [Azotobacter chroococcum]TKD45438.1 hypothetical protein FCG41_04240 [Azotobacter chroococcum]